MNAKENKPLARRGSSSRQIFQNTTRATQTVVGLSRYQRNSRRFASDSYSSTWRMFAGRNSASKTHSKYSSSPKTEAAKRKAGTAESKPVNSSRCTEVRWNSGSGLMATGRKEDSVLNGKQ
jgi:hypothetical protein